jgi:transcriptional regulator with XRE-family HTH domain
MKPGITIRRARISLGLSLAALGRILGVARSTVHRWENSPLPPPAKHIRGLSIVLKVPVERLVGR